VGSLHSTRIHSPAARAFNPPAGSRPDKERFVEINRNFLSVRTGRCTNVICSPYIDRESQKSGVSVFFPAIQEDLATSNLAARGDDRQKCRTSVSIVTASASQTRLALSTAGRLGRGAVRAATEELAE
jgi:hypothetical protein